MSLSAGLRLLLLAALLLAPVGRIGMAEAMTGHCGTMSMAAAQHGGSKHESPVRQHDRMASLCLTACAAIAALPAPVAAMPLPVSVTAPLPLRQLSPRGLHPDAELPPPRLS